MKVYMFLVVSWSVASVLSIYPVGLDDISKAKDFTEVNKDFCHNPVLKPRRTKRSTVVAQDLLWKSPVPYVFHEDLELNAKGVILRAFDYFRVKSCIDFIPRVAEDHYIHVKKLNGCFSEVGKQETIGQDLSIGRDCDYVFTVEHEFLHALGFFHEQSRYDRDKYVTIISENIKKGQEKEFVNMSREESTTHGVPYDYWSVMHYGKNAGSTGAGPTIITKDPKFQDVIGQTLGMSPSDVLELNLLYKCNSTVAFKMYCGFSNGTMCEMSSCSQRSQGWEVVRQVPGGPQSDHTSLPTGNDVHGQEGGYFMFASTASGQEGDSARLETQTMDLKRPCPVQCLQFYYYHSGSESDDLNIWIREFQNKQDTTGNLQLMGQITGPPTSHWRLHHVSLNATKNFQVVFEARKGAGSSSGGFSIDDINLSETECPHVTLQIDDFEQRLKTSDRESIVYSPQQYSAEGYAFRSAVLLNQTVVGLYVQLLSGDNDDQLRWPCLNKQITLQMLDQTPNIQLEMSKQRSITTTQNQTTSDGTPYWTNPRETGRLNIDEKQGLIYEGPLIGIHTFASLEEMKFRDFLKGGSAIFIFNFQDLTPLLTGSTLPCPEVKPVKVTHPATRQDEGSSCHSRSTNTSTIPPQANYYESVFNFSPAMVASPILSLFLVLKPL
ncbi:meprin A subunit beta isoform X3 [Fundulus heteroclitus]|uniref:meprin A subunit beta isoform X2 n=1 Tax=Fundulus heteroclitus TaxID=8078 RepID=UPI00165A9EA5|nr:meprin A subunit beta isoform X2 [Fundulus heteroclitus]XP_035991090.1 meprin A subunit beta isoform X3 [Fundulus heteroclitus]